MAPLRVPASYSGPFWFQGPVIMALIILAIALVVLLHSVH